MTSPSLPPQSAQSQPQPHVQPQPYAQSQPHAQPHPTPGQPPHNPAFQGQPGPSAYPDRGVGDRGVGARRIAGWATLAGAVLVAIGSFLPWANVVLAGPVYGTDGDGVITLGVAVPVAILGLIAGLGKGRVWMFAATLFLGLIATAVGAYDLSNISSFVSGESMADLGPGLPVIVVGGLVVLGAAVYGMVKGRRG
ncbi:hypothetical protein NF556_01845 [Ornithinimicrobium faecis]|uniref:Uncharacterized protein n=1 Tax=Ornithinimicrobium faecis TaxID=2934158 RepID=A0ABY4YV56_9MICO|nr:hypothetical protein [Ornithinimicrobium sp. HY1793]USQ80434.1 hypothetical protein NF556_01845 [Ornithinimicrobium sp. HY1793]